MFERANEVADKKYNNSVRILTLQNEIEALTNKINQLEKMQMGFITSETLDNGKPKYPNAESRSAELSLRMMSDKEYIEFKEKLKDRYFSREMLSIENDLLKDRLNIILTFGGNSK